MGLTLPLRLLKSVANLYRVHAILQPLAIVLAVGLALSPITTYAQDANLDQVRSLISAGNYDDALDRLESFLSDDPGHAQGRFLKGIILTEKDQTAAAIEVFARLAAENLGDIYAKMAGLAYDKALQLDRKNESAKAKLALMHDLISIDEPSSAAVTQVAMTKTAVVTTESGPESAPYDVADGVLRRVREWAAAWSDQDVARYLTFYATSFTPADGTSRTEWASVRGLRLTKPRFIRIDIDDARVDVQGEDRVQVTFFQSYQSDTYGDRVRKVLLMTMEDSQWKIVGEVTIE